VSFWRREGQALLYATFLVALFAALDFALGVDRNGTSWYAALFIGAWCGYGAAIALAPQRDCTNSAPPPPQAGLVP
jgi:hypothetical protein